MRAPLFVPGALAIFALGIPILCAPGAAAQTQAQSPARDVAADAPARCAALEKLQIANTVISDAREIPNARVIAPYGPQPGHCVVEGEINRHTGADGNQYGDKFELRLPDVWSGRFLFQGGGGLDGMVMPAVGRFGPPSSPLKTALARGYAVVSTDAGHEAKDRLDASFGSDPQARADYQYRSTDLVAGVAKKIVAAYYGRPDAHSYMAGCSNGGREAMIAAERYPADFDGIVAGDPAFNFLRAAIAEAWFSQKFAEIAPKDASGKPRLDRAFSDSDLALVSQAVLKACDALDGLKDGMIDNPDACRFHPAVLQCTGAKNDSCLSAPQVRALEVAFAGPKNSKGESLYSDWPWDAGIGAPGWRVWTLGTEKISAINVGLYPQFVNHVALPPGEAPIASAFSFDFDADPPRMMKSAALIDADSTNLAAFRQRGGKMILYIGMSSPIFSANDLIRYYRRLAAANGGIAGARQFARLFRIPGMNHCAGGPALDAFDSLAAVQDWVEKGVAPESMIATGAAFPGRSRPLCAYPQISRYKGSGSTDDASNFICQAPQRVRAGRDPGEP